MNLEQAAELNPREFCRDCNKFATWEECAECYKPICGECQIRCASCGAGKEYRCAACALKCGYEKRGNQWYCDGCPLPENVLAEEVML
jgi:hypothetical protein